MKMGDFQKNRFFFTKMPFFFKTHLTRQGKEIEFFAKKKRFS